MRKKIAFIFLVIITSLTYYSQEIAVKGQVSIHNSKYNTGCIEYVPNTFVTAAFSKPSTTDSEGKYKLQFVGISNGEPIRITAEKVGYEVVNTKDIGKATLGRVDPLRIFLAPKGELAAAQVELYNISKKALYEKKDELIRKLKAENNESKEALRELEAQFGRKIADFNEAEKLLNQKTSDLEKQLYKFASELSLQNLDFALALYLEAYELFRKGEIQQVIAVLNDEKLETINQQAQEKLNKSDSLRSLAQQEARENIKNYAFKAEAYLITFNYHKAIACYETIIKHIKTYALEAALLASYSEKAAILCGELYAQLSLSSLDLIPYKKLENIASQGIYHQKEALRIYEKMLNKDDLKLAKSYTNLAYLFFETYDIDSASIYIDKSMEIHVKRLEENARENIDEVIHDDLIHSIVQLAKISSEKWYDVEGRRKEQKIIERSKESYDLAINLQKRKDANAVILGEIYQEKAKEHWISNEEKETLLQKSKVIFEKEVLIEKTLKPADKRLAEIYSELGSFYFRNNDKLALDYYLKASTIDEKIKKNTSYDFFHENRTQNYLMIADLYQKDNQFDEAIHFHEKYIADIIDISNSPYDLLSRFDHIIPFYKDIEDYEKVIFYNLKLLEESKIFDQEIDWEDIFYDELAFAYHAVKDYENEIVYHNKLIQYYKSKKQKNSGFYQKRLRAQAYYLNGNYETAIAELEMVVDYFEKFNKKDYEYDSEELKESYQTLSTAYEKTLQYDKAIAAYEKYKKNLIVDSYGERPKEKLKAYKIRMKELKKKAKN